MIQTGIERAFEISTIFAWLTLSIRVKEAVLVSPGNTPHFRLFFIITEKGVHSISAETLTNLGENKIPSIYGKNQTYHMQECKYGNCFTRCSICFFGIKCFQQLLKFRRIGMSKDKSSCFRSI